ncbi:MAG: hypothetical protein ACXWCN_05880 [Caldimonas sp.]
MRSASLAAVIAVALSGGVMAKLPPQSDEAKAAAAETAAKAAWTDKVGAYKLCLSMDHVAETYRKQAAAAGKAAPAPPPAVASAAASAPAAAPLPPCTDPGPYVSAATPAVAKPLEASGAHSPSGMAVGPPSTKATSAEISPKK